MASLTVNCQGQVNIDRYSCILHRFCCVEIIRAHLDALHGRLLIRSFLHSPLVHPHAL